MIVMLILALVAGAEPADDFTRVVDAIARGGSARPAARRDAARALAAAGAHPVDGTHDLAAAWGAMRTPPYRDRALGPGYRQIAIGGGSSARFEQVFLAGQRARVAVVMHGNAAVRLAVTDDDGQPQCGAREHAGRCDWVPLWTTRYRIELQNPGSAIASYTVVVE